MSRWVTFNRHDSKYLDETPAVYAHNQGDRLLYIGKSANIRRRFAAHRSNRRVTHAKARGVSLDQLAAVERGLIERIKPPMNIQHTGRQAYFGGAMFRIHVDPWSRA